MFIAILIIFVILFLYVLLIIRYYFGWSKTKNISQDIFSPKVSIVIAIRNEENEIPKLLKSLQSQAYSINKLEVILVNDHSTDNTLSLLENYDLDYLKIINMPQGSSGKKDAISMAVSTATGEIIVVSDADCIFTPNWVISMVSYFSNSNIKLVSGPVALKRELGIFQSLQALEFSSLIVSGAGSIGINNAIFCNGANMAYRKEVFLEVNNFHNSSTVSGDDVFLLHSVKAKYPNSIAFAKDEDAIVTTESKQNFSDFINQRKRWTAKSSSYIDMASIYVSYLVLLTNLSFVFLFIMLFFYSFLFKFFALFYLIKFSIDSILLYPILKFLNQKYLIKLIFIFEFFYSFYIILIVIFSFTTKFEWKGRMHIR
jgi:cellulose synthase/poly-beta-1,6-N-acetylglucosamine synthase-like glycosyltransferase